MPSSQTVKTPIIIQQSWNDGLFTLREKRNGLARGTSIEEKCMYVLGLGWKFRNGSEIKDNEVENTLYISLQGLTQESKFLKIGQVLWEQCDEEFILKMITTLSNYSPTQSKMYNQISLREKQNYKGYFSKQFNKTMNRNAIDPASILNRESKQMSSNAAVNSNYKDSVNKTKREFESSKMHSKGFLNRLVKFKTSNAEIKLLAKELEVVLKTFESDNLVAIASSLGIAIESGFNKKFLIEEIKGFIASYVEGELFVGRSGSSKNVYIRQSPNGLNTIKRLLKYTSFAYLAFDDTVSVKELQEMGANISAMRSKMDRRGIKGFLDNLLGKSLDKEVSKREDFLDKVKSSESKKRFLRKTNAKFKKSMAKPLYEFLEKHVSSRKGSMSYLLTSTNTELDEKAIEGWIAYHGNELDMSKSIIGKDLTKMSDTINKLQFLDYSNEQLLEKLMMLTSSMGIEKESYPVIGKEGLGPTDAGFYMVAILRRFMAMAKESKFNILTMGVFGQKYRGNKNQYKEVMSKISDNMRNAESEKAKDDKIFSKGPDGIFSPLSLDPRTLWKDLYARMQPVYIVGGSVYTFGRNGITQASGNMTPELKATIERRQKETKLFGSGERGRRAAFRFSSMGGNMGAFGTQEAPLTQKVGEDDDVYIRRVIEAKMITEFQTKGMKINTSVQPVFLVNKGITTSNIEATALLNLVPTILEALPGIGTAAGMAFRALMQGEIDAAKNLPKFARGGSFTTRNTNVSQFISGDSINNRINPERVTIDWASQRVNVQPLNNTTNNVTNVESGRITDPIMGTPTTIRVSDKGGKSSEAMSVYNAINPFDENLSAGNVSATPMEVLVSLKESLVEILGTLVASNQTEQTHAAMTAKVVDAINSLNKGMSNNNTQGSSNIFAPIGKLARGE